MIDAEGVKSSADLLVIIGHDTQLKKAANTGGGEYKGACPFCGGTDRFAVQPHQRPYPLWMCRNCTKGKWDTIIGYIARRDKLDPKRDFQEICKRAGGVDYGQHHYRQPAKPEIPAETPPAGDWQQLAAGVIPECEAHLWQPEGARALQYLRDRGLKDKTIKDFRLGYNPTDHKVNGQYWLDRGITIPCEVCGEVWYIKVRRPIKKGSENKKNPKYRCMAGSRPKAIYNAHALIGGERAVFVEGEFDCMIGQQEIGDVIDFVTFGSNVNLPDLAAWGHYLTPLKTALLSYDLDKPGEEGLDRAIEFLGDLVELAPLPKGDWKDLSDYYKAGGNVWEWIEPYLTPFSELS